MCFKFMYDVCWKCDRFKVKEALCLLYGLLFIISCVITFTFSIIWLYNSFRHYLFIPEVLYGPFFLLFFLGLLNPFLAWLGIRGCSTENDCHLILFMALMILSIIFDLTLGTWCMIIWNDSDVEAAALIDKAITELTGEGDHYHDFDRLHVHLECCGEKGPPDFKPSPPISCCTGMTDTEPCPELFSSGCLVPLQRYCQWLALSCAFLFYIWAIFKALGVATYIIYYKSLRVMRKERKMRLLELERQKMIEIELATREEAIRSQTVPHSEAVAETVIDEVVEKTSLSPSKASSRQASVKGKAPSVPVPPDVLPTNRPENGNIKEDSKIEVHEDQNGSAVKEAPEEVKEIEGDAAASAAATSANPTAEPSEQDKLIQKEDVVETEKQ